LPIDGQVGRSNRTTDKSILHGKNPARSKYGAEGCFTKACVTLSMGCDMIKVRNGAKHFFFLVMAEKDKYSLEDCIRIIKNQPSLFPWLELY